MKYIVECQTKEVCSIEDCPFRYGVDYDHFGETFPVNVLTNSDTASEFKHNKNNFVNSGLYWGWWVRCSKIYPEREVKTGWDDDYVLLYGELKSKRI